MNNLLEDDCVQVYQGSTCSYQYCQLHCHLINGWFCAIRIHVILWPDVFDKMLCGEIDTSSHRHDLGAHGMYICNAHHSFGLLVHVPWCNKFVVCCISIPLHPIVVSCNSVLICTGHVEQNLEVRVRLMVHLQHCTATRSGYCRTSYPAVIDPYTILGFAINKHIFCFTCVWAVFARHSPAFNSSGESPSQILCNLFVCLFDCLITIV